MKEIFYRLLSVLSLRQQQDKHRVGLSARKNKGEQEEKFSGCPSSHSSS